MPAKSVTLHIRVAPSVFEHLKAEASARRWKVAGAASILLEEKLADLRAAATAPTVAAPTMSRDADVPVLMTAIHKAMEADGQPHPSGRRVALSTVQKAFYAERSDRADTTNRYKYFAAMKVLIEQGVVGRGNGWCWMETPRS
jgi:hypothetical protein